MIDYATKYDMSGDITIGTGKVRVHDIFDPMPEWFKADVAFTDLPGNMSALNGFITKAGRGEYQISFDPFLMRVLDVIGAMRPKIIYVETFKPILKKTREALKFRYAYYREEEITYYKKNICYLCMASNTPLPDGSFAGQDEADIIRQICQMLPEGWTIADPLMGMGLVGFWANYYGKKFVGTELNARRLACLLESINTGKKVGK